jgi:alpha(1,3/1,4) fucosyltransferase
MDKLKIWFTDFWPEWNEENFISPILKNHFELVLDKNNPDVVFHSIFGGRQESLKYKCKKILYLGENWRPEQFKSDYSISFDPHSTTNYRLPLWQVYILLKPELKERLYNRLNWKEEEFQKWCAFVVSNSSNFMRNAAFIQLNNYKNVKSYGRYLTNDSGLQQASKGRYWRDAKDEFFLKHPHKFMMAYENTPYRFYCTEKLMDAFLVGSMPIYCGDPRVGEDWNKQAFIDGTKGFDFERIKKMDSDYGLFKSVYEQPVFTEEQKHSLEWNLSGFEEWLVEIVKK